MILILECKYFITVLSSLSFTFYDLRILHISLDHGEFWHSCLKQLLSKQSKKSGPPKNGGPGFTSIPRRMSSPGSCQDIVGAKLTFCPECDATVKPECSKSKRFIP